MMQKFRRTRRVLNWFLPLSESGKTFVDARERIGVVVGSWVWLLARFRAAWRIRNNAAAHSTMPHPDLRAELLRGARDAWCSGVLMFASVVVMTFLWSLLTRQWTIVQIAGCALGFCALAFHAGFIIVTAAAEARSLILGRAVQVGEILRHPAWWQPWGGYVANDGIARRIR